MEVANISVERIYERCFNLGLTAKVCYVRVFYTIYMAVLQENSMGHGIIVRNGRGHVLL